MTVKNGVCLNCGYMVLNSEKECSKCGALSKSQIEDIKAGKKMR